MFTSSQSHRSCALLRRVWSVATRGHRE